MPGSERKRRGKEGAKGSLSATFGAMISISFTCVFPAVLLNFFSLLAENGIVMANAVFRIYNLDSHNRIIMTTGKVLNGIILFQIE
jgi:hypothetical protein